MPANSGMEWNSPDLAAPLQDTTASVGRGNEAVQFTYGMGVEPSGEQSLDSAAKKFARSSDPGDRFACLDPFRRSRGDGVTHALHGVGHGVELQVRVLLGHCAGLVPESLLPNGSVRAEPRQP